MAVTRSGVRISTQSDFSTYADTLVSGEQAMVRASGLTPATTYYARALAESGGVIYQSSNSVSFTTRDYMRFRNAGSGYTSLVISRTGAAVGISVDYSYDGESWLRCDLSQVNDSTQPIPPGGYLFLRGWNRTLYDEGLASGLRFSSSGQLYAEGDVMTLFDPDVAVREIPRYGLYGVFQGFTGLLSVPDFSGVTAVDDYGLAECFRDCSSLQAGADLSNATTRTGEYAFFRMCKGCLALEDIGRLPVVMASTPGMCAEMFSGCASLAKASVKEIAYDTGLGGFERMFYGCGMLKELSIGLTTYDAANHTDWLYGCAATGTIYALQGVTIPSGYNGVPAGWNLVRV